MLTECSDGLHDPTAPPWAEPPTHREITGETRMSVRPATGESSLQTSRSVVIATRHATTDTRANAMWERVHEWDQRCSRQRGDP